MKKNVSRLFLTAAVVAVLAFASTADAQRRASAQVGPSCAGGLQALFDEIEMVALTDEEALAVLYLWEEEKLARDVYLTLAERWQLPIFSNIARAEQNHMDMVWKLIDLYGITHPFAEDVPNVFDDDSLAQLYSDLVATGETSLVDALWVGATIEDLDLADLYLMLESTDNDHLEMVAYNLAKGSRNHLRAFVRALGAQGETYDVPQYLEQEDFDAAIAAGMESRVFFNADGEPIAACGGELGGFGMRRGHGENYGQGNGGQGNGGQGNGQQGNGGNGNGNGNGGQGNGTGSGSGGCDGSGSTGGGNGNGGS